MLKFANQVIDAHDDVLKDYLPKVAALGPNVNMMTEEQRSQLPDHAFALSVITKKASKLNKFPIVDRDSTWLSNQYFAHTHHKLADGARAIAAANIKTACDRFGVVPSRAVVEFGKEAALSNLYAEQETKAGTITKTASLDKLARVQDIADNYSHAQYAMPTQEHVKLAAAYFDTKHEKMPLPLRVKYAAAVQMRAKELGMQPVKGTIGKYAADAYSGAVDAHIRSRMALLAGRPDMQDELQKVASMRAKITPVEFAGVCSGFDKKAGLSRYYGSHLTDPFESTFAKIDGEPTTKVGSRTLRDSELKSLATAKYGKIKEYFGSSLADEFKKEPMAIFESLPNDSKEILVNIADGAL